MGVDGREVRLIVRWKVWRLELAYAIDTLKALSFKRSFKMPGQKNRGTGGSHATCGIAAIALTGHAAPACLMHMTSDSAARRPLKSRGTTWAQFFSRRMLAMGMKPNTVSLLSMVCAVVAGGAAWMASRSEPAWVFWFIAAVGVQLRLFCNLMDGLLAVEGGLKSVTGELFNEIPDRISDAFILVPLGYAGATEWTVALGWAAAVGALLTAYLRALGASITGKHDFSGPMAKPHRMAAVTVTCLGMIVCDLSRITPPFLLVGLAFINAGILITCWRRTRHLSNLLNQETNS